MNKTLNEIQSELKVWTEYNFGQQTPEIPILSMIEELGELSHAILKEKQDIRQSDFLSDKKDAIADLTIYCLNYLNTIDKPYRENSIFEECSVLEYLQLISKNISKLTIDLEDEKDIHFSTITCNVIIIFIQCLSKTLDIDFLTTVNEVWEQVKLRDWKKYPKDGITN